jgi:hypothetical protein
VWATAVACSLSWGSRPPSFSQGMRKRMGHAVSVTVHKQLLGIGLVAGSKVKRKVSGGRQECQSQIVPSHSSSMFDLDYRQFLGTRLVAGLGQTQGQRRRTAVRPKCGGPSGSGATHALRGGPVLSVHIHQTCGPLRRGSTGVRSRLHRQRLRCLGGGSDGGDWLDIGWERRESLHHRHVRR